MTALPLLRNAKSSTRHSVNGKGKDMGITTTDILTGEKKKKERKEKRHHPDFSPSSFPALQTCPCYKSRDDSGGDALERGIKLHEELEELLTSKTV